MRKILKVVAIAVACIAAVFIVGICVIGILLGVDTWDDDYDPYDLYY